MPGAALLRTCDLEGWPAVLWVGGHPLHYWRGDSQGRLDSCHVRRVQGRLLVHARPVRVERAVQPAQVLLPRRRGEGGAVSWMLECTRVLQNYCTYYLLFSTEENGTGKKRRGTASLDRTSSVRTESTAHVRTVLCEGSSSLNSLLCYVCFTDSIVCMVYFV